MSDLKPCPYRVHGERKASLTIAGEYYYDEYFMPCMERKCPCFHIDCGDASCDRGDACIRLGKIKGEEE